MDPNTTIETAEAVERAQQTVSDEITLSSGVVLKCKPANSAILMQVMSMLPPPSVPTVFVERMNRFVENYDDPNYLDAVKNYESQRAAKMLPAMIQLGTDLKSKPKKLEGYKKPQENECKWLEDYKLLGLPLMPDSDTWRYMVWVQYVAGPTNEDLEKIMETVGRLSGVSNKTVKSAEDFPGSDEESR